MNLTPSDLSAVQQRIAECDEYIKHNTSSPIHAAIQRYSRFLAAIRRRDEGDGGNKAEGLAPKLRELFGGPLMRNVHTLSDREGTVYYLKDSVSFVPKTVANLAFINDFRGGTHNKSISVDDLKSRDSVVAPQSAVSEAADKQISALTPTNWEPRLKALCNLVQEQKSLDPFLQYALLRYTLEYAAAGSEPLEPELRKAIDALRDPEMDLSTRWMIPKDAKADAARDRARTLLARIVDLDSAWQRAEQSRQGLERALFARCLFIGTLARKNDREWACMTRWTPNGEYELVIAVPGVGKDPPTCEPVGRVSKGHIELNDTGSTNFREGRLVVARLPPASTETVSKRSDILPETVR